LLFDVIYRPLSRAELQKLGYTFSLVIGLAPIIFETPAITSEFVLDLGQLFVDQPSSSTVSAEWYQAENRIPNMWIPSNLNTVVSFPPKMRNHLQLI
jgi:hypothetical protein